MYWSPNFLAVVFKKQEISQQVLLLMSAEVTRMQDLASEFSKISGGDTPGPPQWEGRTPPALTPSPALGPKPWSPSTFQSWLHPAYGHGPSNDSMEICGACWCGASYKHLSAF